MRKSSSKDPDALTEDEVEFLRSDKAPASVRQFASRQHESMGVRTNAYRKVAAAARAEREALMEIATLAVVRASALGDAQTQDRVKQLETERRDLTQELEKARRALTAATAAPALVVHSGGRD